MRIKRFLGKALACVMALSIVAAPVKAEEKEPYDQSKLYAYTVEDEFAGFYADAVFNEASSDFLANYEMPEVNSAGVGVSSGQERNWSAYNYEYAYPTMTPAEKELIKKMKKACDEALNTKKDYPVEDISGDWDYMGIVGEFDYGDLEYEDARMISCYFAYLYPQYYFLSNWYGASEEDHVAYLFMYEDFADGYDRAEATKYFYGRMDGFKSQIMTTTGRYNKELAAHDLLCNSVSYDYDNYLGDWNQTAYSLVCMDMTVCAGYSKAYAILANSIGIETIAVTSLEHAWNKVYMYDNWYNVDLTWDDDPNGVQSVGYDFFNFADPEAAKVEEAYYNDDEDYLWFAYCHFVEDFWNTRAPQSLSNLYGPSAADTDPVAPSTDPADAPQEDEGIVIPNPAAGFYIDENGDIRCNNPDGTPVINDFRCDGVNTYYLQADGTAMRDRLTYHPDGIHVIYFDKNGCEVFSDFANVKKSIAGTPVDDLCFFNVYGYMYVDTLTYDKTGTVLYYINPYGVMERNGWFEFSGHEFEAGLGFSGRSGGYGYAYSNGALLTNTYTTDWNDNVVYVQGDGHMFPDQQQY